MDEVKQLMMVVGIRAIEDNLMEIELVQMLHKQKKVSMLQLANMDAIEAAQLVKGTTVHRDKIHLPRQWISDNNILPFTSMYITLSPTTPEQKDEISRKFK